MGLCLPLFEIRRNVPPTTTVLPTTATLSTYPVRTAGVCRLGTWPTTSSSPAAAAAGKNATATTPAMNTRNEELLRHAARCTPPSLPTPERSRALYFPSRTDDTGVAGHQIRVWCTSPGTALVS